MIEYLRASEVAAHLGVHRVTIYARIRAGNMPEPDAVIRGADAGKRGDGTIYLWTRATIDAYEATAAEPTWFDVDKGRA